MDYLHIITVIVSLSTCYIWGDWRRWEKYYPTILFFILGNLVYRILFHNNLLWLYVSPLLNHTLIDILITFTVFPSTLMVFIPNYPRGTSKQVVYIFFWVCLYSAVEYISHILGAFKYDNGWNTLWSILFNISMFSLLYLHYKKPLLAWISAIAELIVCIVIFEANIMNLI